jgi:spoIIIJ-associated protein
LSNTIEFEGRTEQEAVTKACTALKLTQADLDYTMLDEGSAGVFGLGARPVRIRVRAPEGSDGMASASPNNDVEDDEERGGIVGPAPEKAAKALEVAQGLADRMGLKATITVRDENEQIVVLIEEAEGGTDVAETLGKSRPPAIPSFQFLLNKIVNRFPDDRKHIIVEVPSVPRKERREPRRQDAPRGETQRQPVELDPNLDPTLVAVGRFLAQRAQQLGKVITVHPMLPSDRRAVHQTIMSIQGVHTISEGEGLYRRMHVIPDALKEGGGGGKRRRRRRRRGRGRGRDEGSGQNAPGENGPDESAPSESAGNEA